VKPSLAVALPHIWILVLHFSDNRVSRELLWIGAPIKYKFKVCAFGQTLALAASTMKLHCIVRIREKKEHAL